MSSNAVEKIVLAENRAAERMESAYQEAELILAKANLKAKEMMAQADTEAEADAALIKEKTKKEIEAVMAKGRQLSAEDDADIRGKAQAKKAKAMDLVIRKMISKS